MKIFTVAFFGHRYIDNPFRIEDRLEEEIRRLISEHEYVDFLVGRDGEFDQFASSAVLRVRKQYRDDNSSLVLVLPYARAEYLNNEESYHDYYLFVEQLIITLISFTSPDTCLSRMHISGLLIW